MDSRRYIRHPSNIPIEYSIREGIKVAGLPLADVGYGGLSFHVSDNIAIGQQLQLCIPSIRADVHIEAIVSWCEKSERGYQVGIKFLKDQDRFTMRMIEQVCHIETYRQQVLEQEGRELDGSEAAQEWIRLYAEEFPSS